MQGYPLIIPDDIADKAISLKDRYFDLRGLAVYSSLGVSTLRDHIRKGLPCFKIGGKILIRLSEFDKWIDGYRLNNQQDLNALVDDVMDQLKV